MNFGTRLRRTRRERILQPNQTPLGNGNCLLMIALSFKPSHRGCTNCDEWFHKFDLSFIYLTLVGEYFDRRRVKHSDRPTRITVTAIRGKICKKRVRRTDRGVPRATSGAGRKPRAAGVAKFTRAAVQAS